MEDMREMNIDKVSDEEMQDLFTESFEAVGKDNEIGEYECTCKRTVGGTTVSMEVMVAGLAGTPTYEDLHNEVVESLEVITISREDKGQLDFKRDPEEDYVLNTNDYVVVYKSV